MPAEITVQQTPDDATLLGKREQIAANRATIAPLKTFEGRYVRQRGTP